MGKSAFSLLNSALIVEGLWGDFLIVAGGHGFERNGERAILLKKSEWLFGLSNVRGGWVDSQR